ncbi:MAG: phasin family protein [Proteobacteria bacterium]|nr:phasin family protein [Pseudomonadota bacterium]
MASEAKIDTAKAAAAAEKAYADAAGKVEAVKVEAKPATAQVAAAPAPKIEVVATPVAPVAKPAAAPKAVSKVAAKPAKAPLPKPAVKKAAAKKAVAKKTVKAAAAKPTTQTTITKFKDTIMTKTKTTTEDFTAKVKEAVTDAQDRAKVAFEKGQALFGEAGEFTKGNVEALVESGKILAAGLQEMGKDYVAEGKVALETAQADIKDLAAVKSPADFFKLQGEILRRNFDAAVATGSKRSEAVLKLANDAFAPISTRVSVAVEKVKKAA